MDLREYQTEAIQAITDGLSAHGKALLVLPTGTGKTIVFAHITRSATLRGERVMIIAHTSTLLRQARDKLLSATSLRPYEIGTEQAEQTVLGMRSIPPVVIASKDSLHSKRIKRFPRSAFSTIIVDEAHRGVAATYTRIYEYFQTAKLLGVTATPSRRDGRDIRRVFGDPVYVYEIRDAIDAGYLVPISVAMIYCDGIDLSNVKTIAGDLSEADLEKIMTTERALHEVAVPTIEQSGDRPTLVFCTSVDHARKMAEVLNRYRPNSARHIDGGFSEEDRVRVTKQFHDGEFQYLCNCALLLEGYDEPRISCIAMARPTMSKTLYAQAVGRGTRVVGSDIGESILNGKHNLLLLDFVGNSGKHDLVCGFDVIDGAEDKVTRTRAIEMAKRGRPVDIIQTIQKVGEDIAAEKRKQILANVKYRVSKIDPLALLGVNPRAGRWNGAGVTDRQTEFLLKNGFTDVQIRTFDKGQASEIIDSIIGRRQRNECTLKQAKVLARAGIDPSGVSFDQARKVVDALAANGWKTNASIRSILKSDQKRIAAERLESFFNF